MNLANQPKDYYHQQKFKPGIISIFINPFYFIRKGLYQSIKQFSPQLAGTMLDFGCGSKPYEHLFNVDNYIGLDIKNRGHEDKNQMVDVFYDGERLPFPDDYFDSVFSSEALFYVPNLDAILMEFQRVMKKDTLLLITVPFVWNEHVPPHDLWRFSSFGIRQKLEQHQFEILEIRKTNHFIDTLFQLWNLYLFNLLYTKNRYFNIILNVVFIFPFTLLGVLVSAILPKKKDLYHSNVVLAKKT